VGDEFDKGAEQMEEADRAQVARAGMAEGEDVGNAPGAPGTDEPLREEDVTRADGLDDRVAEEELPGDDD
jgi:hypothetical protein